MQGFIAEGVSSVVVHVRWPDGEWSKGFGLRDRFGSEPAQPQDRFSIGSVTKPMVAVAMLQLVDDGLIGLDDSVNEMLESFGAGLKPPMPITVRQLLNHTSGMPDFVQALERTNAPKDVVTTSVSVQRGLELTGALPWDWRSVGFFAYSNSNYLALGRLVEKLTGRPLDDVLRERVFGPLGLGRTSLNTRDRAAPDNLRAYMSVGGERLDITQPEAVTGSPAGGVVSSTEDVNDFFRGLLSGALLSPGTLQEMKTVKSSNYGLGVTRFPDGCSSSKYRYGHFGSVYGYLTGAISSDDGSRQITLGMALPPLPSEPDAATDRRIDQYASQIELAAQKTLDQLC
ncbi:serine hydrolase domain-containing protein [Paenarthrobacter sp. NPDC089675]|uniref:serine hydrolase domain-containing protein n=1 Tax=Paenarthrobacter sp. NPDC089675 TaxID=3364376 RepID=UPI0037F30B58